MLATVRERGLTRSQLSLEPAEPVLMGNRQGFRAALTELAQLDKSDLDAALRKLVSVASITMRAARVSFWELSTDHSAITCRVLFESATGTWSDGTVLRACDFPAYFKALLECRTIVANDAWTDARTNEFLEAYFAPHNIRAMLDVPVWRQGRLAGVLCHEHVGNDARTWLTEEQDFALGMANLISVALESLDRRRAEESYALIAQATNDVLWDWDLTSDTVEWNDAIVTVFRHKREDIIRDGQWWISRIYPADRERVKASLARVFASGESAWSEQYRWICGDGMLANVIDRGLAVRNEHGVVVRMVGSLLDITERLQMHERLALSDRMASIGRLAAGVAHEINNPLTYIKGNLTCAMEELRAGGNINVPALLELLQDAQEGAERVRRIVRDLQTMSRPREDEIEMVDVHAVIESSLSMAANELRHRATVVKELGPTPGVRMNRALLGQIVLNLLINSAQAIQEGAVDDNRVCIRTATCARGEAIIEIRDTGCGIPADATARIFEPFFTTKPVGVGTGLGLSICHSIVTAAGGRIEMTSPSTGGCCVTVHLPPGEVVVAKPTAEAVVTQRRRVLVVDDEAPVRRVLTRMLGRTHDVVAVKSGEAALAKLRESTQYDVILCDLMMPHMTGMQIHAHLARENTELASRMIFMTGGAFSAQSAEFLAECELPVIEKPLEVDAFTRAVGRLDTQHSVLRLADELGGGPTGALRAHAELRLVEPAYVGDALALLDGIAGGAAGLVAAGTAREENNDPEAA